MTIQEKAQWLSEFYAAVAAGKTAQCFGDQWVDVKVENGGPDMRTGPGEWRIKPEPRRMWTAVSMDQNHLETNVKATAEDWACRGYRVTEWMEVV